MSVSRMLVVGGMDMVSMSHTELPLQILSYEDMVWYVGTWTECRTGGGNAAPAVPLPG